MNPSNPLFPRVIRRAAISGLPLPGFLRIPQPTNGRIFLTFDDGPLPEYTPQLLDLLARRRVKATFFVLGQELERHPSLAERIVKEGHALGNHSFAHPNLDQLTVRDALQEVERCQQIISTLGGTRLFRPPRGRIGFLLWQRLVHLGYRITLWNVDSLDWRKNLSPDTLHERLQKHVTPGSVVLCHDDNPATLVALDRLLPMALDRGWKFDALR